MVNLQAVPMVQLRIDYERQHCYSLCHCEWLFYSQC